MTPDEERILSEYDKEVRPGCLCISSRNPSKHCGNGADYFVRIPHSYGSCGPAYAWICDKCYQELQSQNYPALCPTCRKHVFHSITDMIEKLEEL